MVSELKPEIVNLTPQLAKKFSQMEPAKGERPRNPSRLKFHRRNVENDYFFNVVWATVKMGDKPSRSFRVDGQHTSSVLADANGNFPSGRFAVVRHFKAETLSDLEQIFRIFDAWEAARTTSDCLAFYLGCADMEDCNLRVSARALAGVGIAVPELKNRPRERGLALTDESARAFVRWMHMFQGMRYEPMFTPLRGVVAEMYDSWVADATKATQFWELVYEDSHPSSKHVTRNLVRKLQTMKGRKVRGPYAYRKVARTAWRKWYGEQVPEAA